MCEKFSLIKTNNFKSFIENGCTDIEGILLVHDKISEEEEARIRAKFPPGSVRFVGALWFYLSIYFNIQLPIECFEPAN